MSSPPPTAEPCPFCTISKTYPPFAPSSPPPPSTSTKPPSPTSTTSSPGLPEPEVAYTLLSTPHVLAFLDHMPITRGHVLVTTRQHREKLSDVTLPEAAVLGAWLSVLSRAVMRAVGGLAVEQRREGGRAQENADGEGDGGADVKDWNVVQNNGARAAQVVKHVHYHIIPRPNEVAELKARSWTMFGRGQRGDLDDDEALLVRDRIRMEIKAEVDRLGPAERRILGIEDVRDERLRGESGSARPERCRL